MRKNSLQQIVCSLLKYQTLIFCNLILFTSLDVRFSSMNWLSPVASQDKKTIQQKPQLEQRLPTVVDMLPYSQGSVQKVLTLWSVEVPYSGEAVEPFYKQLHSLVNRAFILST